MRRGFVQCSARLWCSQPASPFPMSRGSDFLFCVSVFEIGLGCLIGKEDLLDAECWSIKLWYRWYKVMMRSSLLVDLSCHVGPCPSVRTCIGVSVVEDDQVHRVRKWMLLFEDIEVSGGGGKRAAPSGRWTRLSGDRDDSELAMLVADISAWREDLLSASKVYEGEVNCCMKKRWTVWGKIARDERTRTG